LNIKGKGKCSRVRPRSRWEQQVRKDITQKKGRTWEESKKICGKMNIN
jgi:hypothetical protein